MHYKPLLEQSYARERALDNPKLPSMIAEELIESFFKSFGKLTPEAEHYIQLLANEDSDAINWLTKQWASVTESTINRLIESDIDF